jgi:hypothetical protein
MTDEAPSTKMMSLRYAGACRECGTALPAGTWAQYDRASKSVACARCAASSPTRVEVATGVAGASAQRQFESRKDKRETRIRSEHPHLGGVILALTDDPQSTRAWQTGARGEVILGRRLDALEARGVRVLHDRRIPGTQANVDHIAIGPRGVFVIDAKKYAGRPYLRASGRRFGEGSEALMVGSHNRTNLVDGLEWQAGLIADALVQAGHADVPAYGMLCFVDADWPLLGGNFTIGTVEVLWPRKAASRVTSPGALTADEIQAVHRSLALQFPPA